MQYVFLICA